MRGLYVPAFAALAAAAPTKRASAINDGVILNYALTLEHLEDTFYREAVAKFNSADFEKAGLGSGFYNNLLEVASDERTHVSYLTTALQAAKVTPVEECTYSFPYTDVAGFLALSSVLEGVGVSAYLGAAHLISNPAYITAAGSILTIEARHSAYIRHNQVPGKVESPFPAPFDIALDFDEVYSMASMFITSCPKGSPALPFKAFPALTLVQTGELKPGSTITLTTAQADGATAAYFITASGPVQASYKCEGTSHQVVIPKSVLGGQNYVVLTSGTGAPTDSNIVAGPTIVSIVDNDFGQ